MARSTRRARRARTLTVAVVVLALLGVGVVALVRSLQQHGLTGPVPGQQRCVATAGGRSVVLGLEQARLSAVIVGLSVRRGLPPRAASIAMATVYQETGIRNLDYGDRDSVGLFQQRPSQGWGTEAQLLDPYYATGKFYDALVMIDGWEDADITEVAQRVQRSGYPEAYRDHERDARVLASALTGETPRGLTCLDRTGTPGNPAALARSLRETFGKVGARTEGRIVTIEASSTDRAWAYASYAVAGAARYGVVAVETRGRTWRTGEQTLPSWSAAAADGGGSRTVTITLR